MRLKRQHEYNLRKKVALVRRREDAGEIVKKAKREYRAFRRMTLRKGKGDIWEDSGRIHFYCTVMEYFRYCGGERKRWHMLQGLALPIRAMWNCYLKYDYLEYGTWQGIEGILEQMKDDCQKAEIRSRG